MRDLAHATPTCREFQEGFSGRIAEERAKLILVAEQMYGKMFSGFVNAFRRLLHNLDAYPGLLPGGENTLYINAAGEPEIVNMEQWKRTASDHRLLCMWKMSGNHILEGEMWAEIPDSWPYVTIEAHKSDEGALEWKVSALREKGHQAAVGLILALRGDNLGGSPGSQLPPAPKRVVLDLWGLSGDADKGLASDLVRPLRFAAGSVVYEDKGDTLVDGLRVVGELL